MRLLSFALGAGLALAALPRPAAALGELKDVLDAYAANDLDAALAAWRRDGAIDALNNSLFRELLASLMEDPRSISFRTHLLFCAKNIERIGDHATADRPSVAMVDLPAGAADR